MDRGMERVKGIEPSYSAWEAAALPLSYTRSVRRALAQHRAHGQSGMKRRRPIAAWEHLPAVQPLISESERPPLGDLTSDLTPISSELYYRWLRV